MGEIIIIIITELFFNGELMKERGRKRRKYEKGEMIIIIIVMK